jgi:hypothetical protein
MTSARWILFVCVLTCGGCATVRPKIAIRAIPTPHGKTEIVVEIIPEISLDNHGR